ncbi:MAG: hypothetical protein EBV16_10980 [Betaproteobacteria bacterium]|jgi:hypothetical protein|nr:hypothetical protein [Betaproteobacteria bacterium]HAB47506.1 hypothetical protein [Lautropia sp.]NBP34659.1 hypothetical protein [Betaproteobacteria bacterium]NBP38759.1 hypothetical protein [Betaproteobacteria bacterium]NBY54247.1 hypothetical protein [Betaproteobacteria bacterium]
MRWSDMSVRPDPSSQLTNEEQALLREIAGLMIPASETFSIPGADDPLIHADILASIGRDLGAVRDALTLIQDLNPKNAASVHGLLQSARPDLCASLISVITRCYYRDDRVMTSIGMAPRSPYPQGFTIEPSDFDLLEAVKAGGRRYRLLPEDEEKSKPG